VAKAAKVAGVNVQTLRVTSQNSAQGEEIAKAILQLPSIPTAVFCGNDLLALGVMRGLMSAKIKVPDQISILGYDDINFASSAAVPLSSIAQPAYQIGVTAADLLLSECEDGDSHQHQQIRFQPQLIERSSTAKR
jgi:LacI family transcriptional regulator